MNLKLITNLKFADKLHGIDGVTESGKEMLKNYKGYLYSNNVTYGLVNNFIKEANQYSFDSGVMSVLESVLKYVSENKISWKLASACEAIAASNNSYNYIAKLGINQVEKLLEMNESDVIQYIKAGALKNIQYIPEFRSICKEVYKNNVVTETYTPNYSLTTPISYIIDEEKSSIFSIGGKTYRMNEGHIEEYTCEDQTFNHINSILPNFVIENGTLKYTWNVGMGQAPYKFEVSESHVNFSKGEHIHESFDDVNKMREYADTFSRTLFLNEKFGFLNIMSNIATIYEHMSDICEIDNAKVLITTDGTKAAIIEGKDNLNVTIFQSPRYGVSSTEYKFVAEALNDLKKVSGIDLKESYKDRIDEDAKLQDPEGYQTIQEQLEATKNSQIEIRRKKIEQLAEQFKNDPVRIALLNATARELALLES